ncbi:MAG TPA: tRNA-dihydrouridine synthase, partial [Conexibacter sp.]|nr:tRNA-dihydrouridine synthase [Conexibacter sp.]
RWLFSVAPMMDWTDRHCRVFHRQMSRHALLYTEMLTSGAIIHGDRARLLGFDACEHPVALQLGGSDPRELAAAGGFGSTAHPFSTGVRPFPFIPATGWDDPFPPAATGVELWSLVTDTIERFEHRRDALRFLLGPRGARQLDHPRPEALAAWDRAAAQRRVVAIGGLDAHQFGLRIGGRVPLRLMSYRHAFELLRTHVLLERPPSGDAAADRDAVYEALREGRCYLARDALAPAGGFRFWADGPEHVEIGSEAPAGGFTLHVRLPRRADVRILRDGVEFARVHSGTSLDAPAGEAGVYRVEATLLDAGRPRTWVVSNPIYLRA